MSKRTTPPPRFWTVLGVINALVLACLIALCLGDGDTWFTAILLICAAFLLIMTDIVSVLVALSMFDY